MAGFVGFPQWMSPTIIPGLPLRWYGVMYLFAFGVTFVLFRYENGEESHPGSLEIVERRLDDGRMGIRVIVSVPALPTYVEQNLIDRLERKLCEEVGPPLPAPERPRRRSPSRRSSSDDEEAEAEEEAEEPEEESENED